VAVIITFYSVKLLLLIQTSLEFIRLTSLESYIGFNKRHEDSV